MIANIGELALPSAEGCPDGRPLHSRPPDRTGTPYCPACRLAAASICAFTASRLKLAPFCIGGILDGRLGELRHFLLDEHEAPELVLEPLKYSCAPSSVPLSGQVQALERVEAQVDQGRHVEVNLAAEPAIGLFDEAILEVVDTHCAERAFAEVEDLMAVRRTFAGDHVHLVVAVEMVLVGTVADLLALAVRP